MVVPFAEITRRRCCRAAARPRRHPPPLAPPPPLISDKHSFCCSQSVCRSETAAAKAHQGHSGYTHTHTHARARQGDASVFFQCSTSFVPPPQRRRSSIRPSTFLILLKIPQWRLDWTTEMWRHVFGGARRDGGGGGCCSMMLHTRL